MTLATFAALRNGELLPDDAETSPELLRDRLRTVETTYRRQVLPALLPDPDETGTDKMSWLIAEELARLVGRIGDVEDELDRTPVSPVACGRAIGLLVAITALCAVVSRLSYV